MERKFCYICGNQLSDKQGRSWWCAHCNQRYFDNPRPTADVILFNEKNEVLLAKRAFDPGKGKWDIPGGFVEFNEKLEHAAARELEEELGLKPGQYSELVYNESYTGDYPWGKEVYGIISTCYIATIDSSVKITVQDDVAATEYRALDTLDDVDFSFPMHKQLILDAAKKRGIL